MYFGIPFVFGSITQSPILNLMCDTFKNLFVITMLIDFWQVVIGGAIRALGKQGIFALINFMSYYMIALPLSFYLPFHVGSHQEISLTPNSEEIDIVGLGQKGLWYAIIIGLTN